MFGTIPHLNDIVLTCGARTFHKEFAGHV
jgi:hypothetical protein